jgi:energy-coupling factor transport system ATP-binding protein
MREAVISVSDLEHIYLPGTPLAKAALHGARLTVMRGEIAALVGESGAGKSTLLHYLNGLTVLERRGCVTVLGQDLADPGCDLGALRARVGLVFQHPHHQLFERLVGDDVAFGPRQLGLTRDEIRQRVYDSLAAVGLEPAAFVDRQTFSLSGGEMRRAALAGVLAMRPELLLLDEATTGLDPRGRREMHALLRALRDDQGVTVLIVSNDMGEVAELADRVTVLQGGRTVLEGAPGEVLGQVGRLRACGLAEPPCAQLAATLRGAGLPVEGDPLTVSQTEEAVWRAMTR